MLTIDEVIVWAKAALAQEGLGRVGKLKGETKHGFYLSFWIPRTPAEEMASHRIDARHPAKPGLCRWLLTHDWRLVPFESFIPDLMFDHCLDTELAFPHVLFNRQGEVDKFLGLEVHGYQVLKEQPVPGTDQTRMAPFRIDTLYQNEVLKGVSPFEKYGYFPVSQHVDLG